MKLKWNKEKTRLQSHPKGASMTDQSDQNMVDINSIMKSYARTGLLPQFKDKVESYIDTTQIPSYIESQAQIAHAKDLFSQLPSEIRKLMQNNPENLEKVITNPDYKQIMLKYGIYTEKENRPKKVEPKPSADPAPQGNKE